MQRLSKHLQHLLPFAMHTIGRGGLMLLSGLLLLQLTAWADPSATPVKWTSLGLTPEQESEMDKLDGQWKKIYGETMPQINRDKAELRRLLNSPNANAQVIMDLQNRITDNEQKLRQEATRTFLNKKDCLKPAQKMKLQQIMSP